VVLFQRHYIRAVSHKCHANQFSKYQVIKQENFAGNAALGFPIIGVAGADAHISPPFPT
jgi:hypothetical protein